GVLALVADGADIRPAVGEPADVAAGLIAKAAAGRQVVRLVGGDPLPAYAGVPLGSAHVEADVRAGLDWAALAAVPGPLVLHATAAHLLDVVTGLTAHGLAPTT